MMLRVFTISLVVFSTLSLVYPYAAHAGWLEDGVPVCTATDEQQAPQIVPDGAGGAIIVWQDERNGYANSDIYAQRIDAYGNTLWPLDGIGICTVPRGQGRCKLTAVQGAGAIVVWEDGRSDTHEGVYGQKINLNGSVLWGPNGAPVCTASAYVEDLQIVPDDNGGAIIAWVDGRGGNLAFDIYAQRIDASGEIQWMTDGVAICTADEMQEGVRAAADGVGGAIITWMDQRRVPVDVYAQRIDASGNVQWARNGAPISGATGGAFPGITPDGAGGAIIAWHGDGLYVQRVDASGVGRWAPDGVYVSGAGWGGPHAIIASDGAGGGILTWGSDYVIWTQRIGRNGDLEWGDGLTICSAPGLRRQPQITSDGARGTVITWNDNRDGHWDIYAQRVDASGSILWTAEGVAICTAPDEQSHPVLATDGTGGAIVAWQDYRRESVDIYAGRTGIGRGLVSPLVLLPVITIGGTSTTTLVIYNRFDEPLTVTSTSEVAEPFFLSPGFSDSLASGITIGENSSLSTMVYFNPLAADVYDNPIYFEGTDTGDTLASTILWGTGREISFDWTTAYLYPELQIGIGDTLRIEETMADSVEVDSMLLYYSSGGSWAFESKKMAFVHNDPLNDHYLGLIPASVGGSRGLMFYAAAYNGPVVAFSPCPDSAIGIRVRINNLSFPTPQPAKKYRMISFPIDIPGNTIVGVLDDDLGGRDETQWRMFTYIPSGSHYVEIPNDTITALEQGRAYWLITKETVTLDTEPREAVSTPTDSSFIITLDPGWNMIGNPFNFPVSWDSMVVSGMHPLEQGLVEPPVWWNSDTKDYEFDVEYLSPFEGYWVKNLDSLVVVVRVPPVEAPGEAREYTSEVASLVSDEISCDGWRIRIGVSSAGTVDRSNYIGVERGARASWDKHDRSEPPACPGQSISLYFPHRNWSDHPGLYALDVRGKSQLLNANRMSLVRSEEAIWGHIWQFDIAKNFSVGPVGDEVRLNVEGIAGVPTHAQVYLVDVLMGRLVDLREEQAYCFTLGEKEHVSADDDARFALIVGSDQFMYEHKDLIPKRPARTALVKICPNPFSQSSLVIYEVAMTGDVCISIYDVRGSLVRMLHSGNHTPGGYRLVWDGRDQHGIKVASGVYFCQLESDDTRQVKRLVVLR